MLFAETWLEIADVKPMALSVIYFVMAMGMLMVAWRVIDRITPGDLGNELLVRTQPNLALAVVVGCMVLGVCVIVAAAIH